MNDDPGSTSGPAHRTWWDRLGHMFSGEPRNRNELLEELRAAQTNGLLSVDTLTMVEGAIKVTELSVDDVMVPRAQIVMLAVESPLSEILAVVVESGHSRFPVHGEDNQFRAGIRLLQSPRCFDSVQPRHGYVQQDELRLMFFGRFQDRFAVARRCHHVEFRLQQGLQTLDEDGMVVREQ